MTLAITNGQPVGEEGVRLFQVTGDYMEPMVRSRDFLMAAPCDHFIYDAVYLLDAGNGEESAYIAQRAPAGQIMLRHAHPRYSAQVVSREYFDRQVRGFVIAEIHVKAHDYLRSLARQREAA